MLKKMYDLKSYALLEEILVFETSLKSCLAISCKVKLTHTV